MSVLTTLRNVGTEIYNLIRRNKFGTFLYFISSSSLALLCISRLWFGEVQYILLCYFPVAFIAIFLLEFLAKLLNLLFEVFAQRPLAKLFFKQAVQVGVRCFINNQAFMGYPFLALMFLVSTIGLFSNAENLTELLSNICDQVGLNIIDAFFKEKKWIVAGFLTPTILAIILMAIQPHSRKKVKLIQ